MFDYAPFLERDDAAIRLALRQFRSAHSDDETWALVARFAVLAYAPSQHARHAVIAAAAALDVRDLCGARWGELLEECAIYAAGARLPWSEPPILELPHVSGSDSRDRDALRKAAAEHDRLAAERWLAARWNDSDLASDLLAVAAEDPDDFGRKLVVAVTAFELSKVLGERGRFAVLRIAVDEICAAGSAPTEAARRDATVGVNESGAGPQSGRDGSDIAARLIGAVLRERGALPAMHPLFFYDAAMRSGMVDAVRPALLAYGGEASTGLTAIAPLEAAALPIYPLARDYGAFLRSFGVAGRLGDSRISAAAAENLRSGPSFADWSFA